MRTWIGLHGLHQLLDGDVARVIEAARVVEVAGIDGVTVTDHVVMSTRTDRYPYGNFPLPLDFPWFEPLTLLAAVAGATRRIRLSTGVLIAPLRPAVLLAKMVATLDAVSGGRVDLGVGTGWQREEYEAAGIDFAGRGGRLVDLLRACRALWTAAPASFDSPSVRFADLYSLPHPRQNGGVPIWFGLAARLGADGETSRGNRGGGRAPARGFHRSGARSERAAHSRPVADAFRRQAPQSGGHARGSGVGEGCRCDGRGDLPGGIHPFRRRADLLL